MSFSELSSNFPQSCVVKSCKRDKCSLLLKNKTGITILDLDHKDLKLSNIKRCDFLLFKKNKKHLFLVPIELKSGPIHDAHDAVQQLQGGLDQAKFWLKEGVNFRLLPILAHGKGTHKFTFNKLRNHKVKFRGKEMKIKLVRCGSELPKELSQT